MQTIAVEGLSFEFPDSWKATKYDDWFFYKKQFAKMHNGIKAVDIVAFDEQNTLWLIEAKDFRQHGRQDTTPLHEVVWKKVCDTLAGLFAAKCNAVDEEQAFAQITEKACKIRVIFHIEQPTPSSRLYQKSLASADMLKQLKRKIKPIDPHPLVVSKETMLSSSLQWRVRG